MSCSKEIQRGNIYPAERGLSGFRPLKRGGLFERGGGRGVLNREFTVLSVITHVFVDYKDILEDKPYDSLYVR